MNHISHKLICIALIVASATSGCFAEETADTVKVIENATNIVVVSKNGKTTLDADFPGRTKDRPYHYRYEVAVTSPCPAHPADSVHPADLFPDNWGMEIPFVRTKTPADNKLKVSFTIGRRAYWGWRFNYSGKGNVRNGWEFSIPDFLAIVWKRRSAEFEIGLGVSTSMCYAMDGFCYRKQGDKLILAPTPDNMKVKNSSLETATFQVPVLYNQYLGKDFMLSLGAIMNFNSYAKASTKLEAPDGTRLKTEYKGLQQNLFTVDAYASIDIRGVGIFAKWSPMKTFRAQYGPQMKGITIGLQLALMNW